jgi:hypothetical protein
MTVDPDPHPGSEPDASHGEIEVWELHSELALVCPTVRKTALGLLPVSDPHAFLNRPRAPILLSGNAADTAGRVESLPVAVVGYTLWRLAETARTALFALGAVVALALLAQLLH